MSPFEYREKVGRATADAIARKARISPAYFAQICYAHRRASVDTAKRLVKASGGAMTLLEILLNKRPVNAKARIKRARLAHNHARKVRAIEESTAA